MRLIIYDLEKESADKLLPFHNDSNFHIIANDDSIHNCIGCFGCWIKTPGVCIIKDNYQTMGEILSKSSLANDREKAYIRL